VLLLVAAMFFVGLPFLQATGARPISPGMLGLLCGCQFLMITVVLSGLRTASRRRPMPVRPCRSLLAWIALLVLSLGLAGAGLWLAFVEALPVNRLAAAGRTDLCPARVSGRRWVAGRSGGHYLSKVDLTLGGQSFEDEVPLAMIPPELGWAWAGQVRRVPVVWLPQDPAIHRLGGMSPAVPVLFDLLLGLDMLCLVVGLRLACWYTAPAPQSPGLASGALP
jgi:hypothetical protein